MIISLKRSLYSSFMHINTRISILEEEIKKLIFEIIFFPQRLLISCGKIWEKGPQRLLARTVRFTD